MLKEDKNICQMIIKHFGRLPIAVDFHSRGVPVTLMTIQTDLISVTQLSVLVSL